MSKLIDKKGISDELAQQVVEAAVAHAKKLDVIAVVAVVDESGTLVAYRRMDGAALGQTELAPAKARMAVQFGAPSSAFRDMAASDTVLAVTLNALPGVTTLGGGQPIMAEGHLIGAVGISAPSEEIDNEIAETAAAVAG